jgi:formate hydrogenlyase subunit 3/multisubunit Na+/H+ antiporter MnhD subunit
VSLFLLGLLVLLAGGLLAGLAGGRPRLSARLALAAVLGGSTLGTVPALKVLLGGAPLALRAPWSVPQGEFHLAIDGLGAVFLLPIFVLSVASAVYGHGYLRPERGRRALGAIHFFFPLLVGAMALVVAARNAVLFLVAWEVVSIASFFLVTFEHEREEVRRAGFVYLVATHLGTAFLVAFFLLLGREAGSFDFDRLGSFGEGRPGLAGLLFGLALVGFGTKAGFVPLHVWLPRAHPAAPSHVSALLSGVMIKIGIYGLLRTVPWLGTPPPWWGILLLGIGVTSGLLGVLLAIAQHDLKRLLAYHSVENIGIIALGLGTGFLGLAFANGPVAVLGFAGALLHVWNHGVFKGLLFQGAGAVVGALHDRDLDRMGGLLRRMPWTGLSFCVGSLAICALPPLNGFVSEWILYGGLLRSGSELPGAAGIASIGCVAGLALIGGLAAACFAKAFGAAFLGEPRSAPAAAAREAGRPMTATMVGLSLLCLGLGVLGPHAARLVLPVAGALARLSPAETAAASSGVLVGLGAASRVALVLVGIALGIAGLRALLLGGRAVTRAATWGCGFPAPTPRMQYTASSFVQPLARIFGPILDTRIRREDPVGYFPARASFATHTGDAAEERIFAPSFRAAGRLLGAVKGLQHGRLQLYLLYIFGTLLALLLWKLAF